MRLFYPRIAPLYAALTEPSYALARFIAGAFLVPHGAWKLFGITGGTRADMIDFFNNIGLTPAPELVTLVGIVEFFGGILVAVGLFTRPAALLGAITTGMAAIYFHLPLGFYVENGGTEFASLWTVMLLFIAVRGSGSISVDNWLGREL